MKSFLLFLLFILLCHASHAQNSKIIKGNLQYLRLKFEAAESQYRSVLETDRHNETAQFNLGNALQKQGKYNEAIELSEKLATTASRNSLKAAAYYNEGVAYTKTKNLEASIEAYKKALRTDPSDLQARENLQKALIELKKKNQQQQQQKKQEPKMSQKEAEQKLKLLQQKEKMIQQRVQSRNQKQGAGKGQEW